MSFLRKLFGLTICGAFVGAVLAFASPVEVAATDGCTCSDNGKSNYSCDGQTACTVGIEYCAVTCV